MYKIIPIVFTLFILVGCSSIRPNNDKILTQVQTTTIKVPITYEIPDIDCEFSGTPSETIVKLLDCLTLHKRILENMRQFNNDLIIKYKETINK